MAYWSCEVDVQHSAYGGKNVFNMGSGNDFTFVDFLPEVRDPGGFFTKKTYENFRILVERANEFLRCHRKWKIVTCESVGFNLRDGKLDPSKMTSNYVEYEGETRYFLRGLRLWLTEKQDGNEREQQLSYFNIIPHQLKEAGIISGPKYETLDTVVERLNSMLQSHPLPDDIYHVVQSYRTWLGNFEPGYIITIETQGMKCDNIRRFDADCTDWAEYWTEFQSNERFIIILRIFYIVMAGISEEIIGIQDFIPSRIGEGGVLGKDRYESFSDIADKVSIWCSQEYNARICNVQTLEMWSIKAGTVNTQKMSYSKNTTKEHFVRVLRVAYTKPFANSYSIGASPREIFCRTFLPLQLTSGICIDAEYENLAVTKERISAWVKATDLKPGTFSLALLTILFGKATTAAQDGVFFREPQTLGQTRNQRGSSIDEVWINLLGWQESARVLSAETKTYQIKRRDKINKGSELCYANNSICSVLNWMFVIRLYLDGAYEEPPPQMLPPVPVIQEKSCCCVS